MANKRSNQIGLTLLGLLVAFFGWIAWSLESEYGAGVNFMVEQSSGGPTVVYEVDEMTTDDSGRAVTTPVFEGTEAEAMAYVEERRAQDRNFALPIVTLTAGGLLILAGQAPWRRSSAQPSPV